MNLLTSNYRNDWDLLLLDWVPVDASSFEELRRKGTLFLRPGTGEGILVVNKYVALLVDRYYSLTKAQIQKYGPEGMLNFGDRFMSVYYPDVELRNAYLSP